MKAESKAVLIIGIIAIVLGIFIVYLTVNYDSQGQNVGEQTNVNMLNVEPEYSIESDSVNYYGDVEGYLAQPEDAGAYPGVVMIHEWWGLNGHIKEMAEHLASQGYVVLAVDLYNGQVAEDATEAGQLAGSVRNNPSEAVSNMKAAVDYLEERGTTKVGSLGWCFGGGQSLQLSLNEDVDATVIYYGNLVTNASQLRNLQSPVLGIFGSEDTSIPVSSVRQFEASLNQLDIENQIYIYDGVGHAFANPSGMNYAPEETRDAWRKTLDFLDEKL